MLEPPDIPEADLIACLHAEYEVRAAQAIFLPLGADLNTAVYRVVADTGTPYFLKLRSGPFDETSVRLPKFLSDQGIEQIIPPLTTRAGGLWASLGAFNTILYPFVEGQDGYEVELSDRHWSEFGATLKKIHTTRLPPALMAHLQREAYSPHWRESVTRFMKRIETDTFNDPMAIELAAFLKTKRPEILDLVERTEQYAQILQSQAAELVVCHTDLHAGNVLMAANGAFYLVDWDAPSLAPKERDLMFAGGGQFGAARTPAAEEALFYQGYGQRPIDPTALAYFRYERIIQDIAVYCEQLLLTTEGGEDREQALHYLASNFLPNGTIAIAYKADQQRRANGL
jgi:spectinomycin phosphotransferase